MDNREIFEYLVNGKWNWLIENYSNSDELAEVLYERLKARYNYQGNHDKTIEVIRKNVRDFKKSDRNIEKIANSLCNDLENIVNTNSPKTNYSWNNAKNTETKVDKTDSINENYIENVISNSSHLEDNVKIRNDLDTETSDYLVNGKWNWLIENYSNSDELAEVLYERLKARYNYQGNHDKAIEIIKKNVRDFKKSDRNIEKTVKSLCNELNSIANTSNQINNQRHNTGSRNINMDTDVLEQTILKAKEIQEEKKNNKIETSSYIENIFKEYIPLVNEDEAKITEQIEKGKKEILDVLVDIEALDVGSIDTLKNTGYSFDDLISIYGTYRQTRSKVKLIDKSTFEKCGHTVIGNKVTITDKEGTTYQYDISSGLLKDSKGNQLTVKYFVPISGKLDEMNTITCLSGQREMDMYSTTGVNSFYLGDVATNCILVLPSKKYKNEVNGSNINDVSFSYMSDEVISGTKFATLFSNQSENRQNTILGCSNGGGSAIKIAANSDGLYDNVACINYAFLMNDRGKGYHYADDNRLSQEEAMKLKDINIVFISSNEDPNLNGGSESNMYIGLKNLLKYSPDAKVSFITNSPSKIYLNIEGKNYHYYGVETWGKLFDKSYSGHGVYHKINRDLLNSCIFG